MSDNEMPQQRTMSNAFLVVVGLALLSALGALGWCYGLTNHISALEHQVDRKNTELAQKQTQLDARLSATAETLGQSVGMTQKQIETRTEKIMAAQAQEQKQELAHTAKLEQETAAAKQQIGAVSTEVSSVKTDVGGAKADIASTRSDLEAAKAQMQRMMGDEGTMSGLIATNHDQLEISSWSQLLRVHAAEGREADAALDREGSVEEGGRQALEVHDGRQLRRPEHREEGQEPRRAGAVLQRQGSGSVRDRGQQHLEESGLGLPLDAEERASANGRSGYPVTANRQCSSG
jgi:hypothetical protein